MILIVNKHQHQPTSQDIYIGRGSVLGNPYTGSRSLASTKAQFQCSSREEAIDKYAQWLHNKCDKTSFTKDDAVIDMINNIYLKAKAGLVYLVCFCAPKSCHGDIIKEKIEAMLNEE